MSVQHRSSRGVSTIRFTDRETFVAAAANGGPLTPEELLATKVAHAQLLRWSRETLSRDVLIEYTPLRRPRTKLNRIASRSRR